MALRLRLASVVMSQTSQRLSSSGVRNIGTPLANVHTKEQSRASTAAAPCFAWKEKKPLGITTPEELEKRISAVKVCQIYLYYFKRLYFLFCIFSFAFDVCSISFPFYRNWQMMQVYVYKTIRKLIHL